MALDSVGALSERFLRELLDSVIDLLAVATLGADTAIVPPAPAAPDEPQQGLKPDQERPILPVENDESLAKQLRVALENFGFEVTTLRKPRELRSALVAAECAGVVMDVVFQGDDEISTDTVWQLREDSIPSQPVIFVSGRTDARARIAAVGPDATPI